MSPPAGRHQIGEWLHNFEDRVVIGRALRLKREIDVARVNEALRHAQGQAAPRGASAVESLRRLRAALPAPDGQQPPSASKAAALAPDLDAKLFQAGILSGRTTAEDVLARLARTPRPAT